MEPNVVSLVTVAYIHVKSQRLRRTEQMGGGSGRAGAAARSRTHLPPLMCALPTNVSLYFHSNSFCIASVSVEGICVR